MTGHVRHTPATAREVVLERQHGTCLACHAGMHADRAHLHHRQRRRELDRDQLWCPCTLVALHPDCHVVAPQAVHQRPSWAREAGLIVAPWLDPREVPIEHRWPFVGSMLLVCDGTLAFA